MSSVDLVDKDGVLFSPDVFTRDENGKPVVMQAVVNVDPVTGDPTAYALDAIVTLLSAILDRTPRLNINDRVLVELSESGALGTINGVTSIGDVLRLQALGISTANVTKITDGIPVHLANAGASHIYNNIIVS